jgi:biotin/methionine sulfoxide reductase
MFGGIGRKNAQVSMGGVTRHEVGLWLEQIRRRGARMVNISPQRSDGWAGSDWWPVPPGTDTALMMGVAFALEEAGLTDHGFLARCTSGWERVQWLIAQVLRRAQ